MDFEKALKTEKIQTIMTQRGIQVDKDCSYGEVVARLQRKGKFAAVILEDKKVIGIFTERDALTRGLLQDSTADTPIEKLMTPQPTVINLNDSLAKGIRLMGEGPYRHLPVVNDNNEFVGLISIRDFVFFLSENYPHDVFNQPPDPHKVSAAPEGA